MIHDTAIAVCHLEHLDMVWLERIRRDGEDERGAVIA